MSAAGVGSDRAPRRARDWLLVAVCVLLGGLGGYAYFQLQPPVYTAHTTVLVLPTSGGVDSSVDGRTGTVVIETEAEIANSAEVASQAADKLDGRIDTLQLRDDSEVTVTPNSQVLTVTVRAGDPALARDGAQAIAQAYLEQRAADAKAGLDSTTKTLNGRLDELRTQQKEQSAALDDADSSNRASRQAALNLTVAQIADIQSRLVALQVQSTNGGSIISAATLPTDPTSPVLWIDVVAGLLLGGLVGSGLLLLVDRRRRSRAAAVVSAVPAAAVGTSSSVVSTQPAAVAAPLAATWAGDDHRGTDARRGVDVASGLQVLAALDLGDNGELSDKDSAALRALCRVVGEDAAHPGPLLLVGVDYHVLMAEAAFAVNDAWVAEFGGHALVLADSDTPGIPGRPSLDGRGLSDVLSGEWPVRETVTAVDGGRAAILGPGIDDTDLPPATQRHRLQGLWEDLERLYGAAAVQVQVPFETATAQTIVQTAGPALIVVKGGLSQQQDLTYAVEQLSWLGLADHLVGIISVTGRARTGSSPGVDLTPTSSSVPDGLPAKPARKTAATGRSPEGAGRAGA